MQSRNIPEKFGRFLPWLGWAVLTLLMVALFYQRKLPFFRDYAIIFDGAARLAAGQSPFADFGMPTGPVSLFLPALFMRLFGTSWGVFQASQLVINAMILASLTLLLRQLGQKASVILVAQVCTAALFLIQLTHPWYNSTGLLLLLVSLNFVLLPGTLAAAFAGAVAMVCVFTKQDFGLAALLTNGALLLYQTTRTEQALRVSLQRMAAYAGGLALVFGGLWSLYAPGHMAYWFNYGQKPHTPRQPHFANWTLAITLVFALWLVAVGFLRRHRLLFVCGLVLLAAHLTASLSGLAFTHYYGVMVVPAVIAAVYSVWGAGPVFAATVAASVLVLVPPLRYALPVYIDAATGRYETRLDGEEKETPDAAIVDFGTCAPAFSNVWGPASVCTLIGDLRARVASGALPPRGKILNMSELSPVTAILGYTPPTGHPLWDDPSVSLFPREMKLILDQAKGTSFDLVLVQSVHGDDPAFYAALLQTLRANPSYAELPAYRGAASGVETCLRRGKDCNIQVFVRRR